MQLVMWQVLLISGRKLDYEVNGATAEEEAGFVTLIRFPPGSPAGMATALFNFKSGAMEVCVSHSHYLICSALWLFACN
jgi:hypothetical protein